MTSDRDGRDDKEENQDLAAMHRDLIALVRRLETSIDTAPSPAEIAAISDQIVEVNARVTKTGQVLLAAQTEEIARYTRAVTAAIQDVQREIEELEQFDRVISTVAAVLHAADEAVRVAGSLCR